MIKRIFKKFLSYVKIVLSDSSQASVRRFIGLQAFYLLMIIILMSAIRLIPPTNVPILQDGIGYLFAITSLCIIGVTVSGVAKMLATKTKLSDLTSTDNFNNLITPPEEKDENLNIQQQSEGNEYRSQ